MQRFQFHCGHSLLTPNAFWKVQLAVVRGVIPSHLRYLLYVTQLQHVRTGLHLRMLKLDRSNTYGQTDRDALHEQAKQDLVWSWAITQSIKLY